MRHTCLAMLIMVCFLSGSTVTATDFLSLSTDDYTPDYLWMLDSGHHGASSNPHALYAVLHDVSITTGPVYPSGVASSALYIQGNSTSYVEIANAGGVLDGTILFTWVMVVEPDDIQNNGVILDYGGGGVRIMQSEDDIVVEVEDTGGQSYTVTAFDVLQNEQPTILALSYLGYETIKPGPQIKLYYDVHVSDKLSNHEKLTVANATTLRGTGNVRLGSSFDPSLPAFAGKLSCLRYHNVFVNKFESSHTYPLQCDPNGVFTAQYSLSQYTMDYVESTTPVVTTVTTVLPTTEAQETTKVDTTQAETTQADTTLAETTQADTTLVETTQADTTLAETTQADTTLAETTPADTTVAETTQADTTLAETTQADTTLAETTQADTTLAETTPADTTVAETTVEETTLGDTTLEDTTLVDTTQAETTLVDTTPAGTTPAETTLAETTSVETTPEETTLINTTPETTSSAAPTPTVTLSPLYNATAILTQCLSLQRHDDVSLDPSCVLMSLTTSSVGHCFSACMANVQCVGVSMQAALLISGSPGQCVLGASPILTVSNSGYYSYLF